LFDSLKQMSLVNGIYRGQVIDTSFVVLQRMTRRIDMDQSIQTCLCKQACASGLPKAQALPLVNEIAKWCDKSGVEWTVDRLKSLHHWYITSLSGEPNIPSWVKKSKGLPKGVFRKVFLMKNKQCALAILSLHTAFKNTQVTRKQWKKLWEGVNSKEVVRIPSWKQEDYNRSPKLVPVLKYHSPTVDDIVNGVTTVPVGVKRIHPMDKSKKLDLRKVGQAYLQSWIHLPHPTVMLVERMGLHDHTPSIYDEVYGATFSNEDRPVGIVACIQEPSLKARWIANPNKVTQAFLKPLKREWEKQLKRFPTDCTYNQASGALWVQSKLKEGVELIGVDLKSASDKLSLFPCLDLVHRKIYGATISDGRGGQNLAWYNLPNGKEYSYAVLHFCEVSRGNWSSYGGRTVSWKSGDPLGTYPSFALLGLTNNILGWTAHKQAIHDQKLSAPWQDSYRVIGDDIVMRRDLYPYYVKNVTAIGGEINFDKTISGRAVEFGGRVITKSDILLKRIVTSEISDNSFMQLIAQMGSQSSSLLRPRQRKVWDKLRFVPGVAVDGPFNKDSLGFTLADRYSWYLHEVAQERIKPDTESFDAMKHAQHLIMCLKQDPRYKEAAVQSVLPRDLWNGYQPSRSALHSEGGDPRMVNGKTFLQAMEELISRPGFQSFPEWLASRPRIDNYPKREKDTGIITKVSDPSPPKRETSGGRSW